MEYVLDRFNYYFKGIVIIIAVVDIFNMCLALLSDAIYAWNTHSGRLEGVLKDHS